MSLQDGIHHEEEELPNGEDVFSTAEILEFCNDAHLFSSEDVRSSDLPSSSGCCGSGGAGGAAGDDGSGNGSSENVGCYDDASFNSPFTAMDASALCALLDEEPLPDSTMPNIDYTSPSPSQPQQQPQAPTFNTLHYQQDQLDQMVLTDDMLNAYSAAMSSSDVSAIPQLNVVGQQMPLPSFDEDCMGTLSGYLGLDQPPSLNSCSFMDPAGSGMGVYFPGSMGLPMPREGFYPGSLPVANEGSMPTHPEVAEYQKECGMGFYRTDAGRQTTYNSSNIQMQALGDNQQLAVGSSTSLVTDMPPLDESTFKVGRLTVEERKEKIRRYLKKKNMRNFTKKIKYACRKTLADSRPRVRGRFAKNDELGDASRLSSIHEDEDDEEVKEEDITDSSDIIVHLDSFKCNYSLDSWM